MNRKKRALKGLIILAAVLLVCMFFAKTIQTITTAKVKKIQATRGKLEDRIQLEGEIFFSQGDPVMVRDAKKIPIMIEKALIKEGYFVKPEDEVLQASVPTYQSELEKLKDEYDKHVRELSAEVAGHIRLKQSSPHNELYNETLRLADVFYVKRYEAYSLAQEVNYTLPADPAHWGIPPATPVPTMRPAALIRTSPTPAPAPTPLPGHDATHKVREAMQEAFDAWYAFDKSMMQLKAVYTPNGGSGIERTGDATFDYIKKTDGFREQIDKALNKMLELDETVLKLTSIKAPREGYVTEFKLKAGDTYDGTKPAYYLSKPGEKPVLRCDITNIKKPLSKGMKASVEGLKQDVVVADILVTADNKKFALIELDADAIAALGGLSKLMAAKTPVTILYKSQKTATLIPATALRTDGDKNDYVFVVSQRYGGMLGNMQLVVQKQQVKVVERSDKLVALADDLSYVDIADQEDRSIAEGQTVMEYAQ